MEYRIKKTKQGKYAIQKKILLMWVTLKEYHSQGRAMNEFRKKKKRKVYSHD